MAKPSDKYVKRSTPPPPRKPKPGTKSKPFNEEAQLDPSQVQDRRKSKPKRAFNPDKTTSSWKGKKQRPKTKPFEDGSRTSGYKK